MELDKDLQSIQETRELVAKAKEAQKIIAAYDQEKVNKLVQAINIACQDNAERLAKMAAEETGFGKWEDKVLKNILASKTVCEYMKDMKTVGVLKEDVQEKIIKVAVPVGVVAALVPSTNPTSTVMFKSLICIKSANAVIFSPHPNAKNCIFETVKVIRDAIRQAGAPEDLVQVISIPTIDATNTLMKHKDTGLILATGGPGMVKAAYSSGNPAIGVGAGNGPAFIERTADIPLTAKRIIDSKTFDNGTICASEQSIIVESCIKDQVVNEFKKLGGYFLNEEDSLKVEKYLLRSNGSMNPAIVGKSAVYIAKMAGVSVPDCTKVLISFEQKEVGHNKPYSREKLCPVLGFFVEESWEKACERSMEILANEGAGHTMTIHTKNDEIVKEFAVKKPVMRLLVNVAASLGGVGAATNLAPALTLGCGAVGGSSTSDNVTALNLINIRRVAYGVKEVEDLRSISTECRASSCTQYSKEDIEKITREIISRLTKSN